MDVGNHRIMYYKSGSKEGIIKFGANGKGKALDQLNYQLSFLLQKMDNHYLLVIKAITEF